MNCVGGSIRTSITFSIFNFWHFRKRKYIKISQCQQIWLLKMRNTNFQYWETWVSKRCWIRLNMNTRLTFQKELFGNLPWIFATVWTLISVATHWPSITMAKVDFLVIYLTFLQLRHVVYVICSTKVEITGEKNKRRRICPISCGVMWE